MIHEVELSRRLTLVATRTNKLDSCGRSSVLFRRQPLARVHRPLRAGVVAVAFLVVIGLSGCSTISESIGQSVGDSLHSKISKGRASEDFRKVVGGSWTRMLIVCGPVANSGVDKALGFDWTPPGGRFEVNDSTLLFADGTSIIAHYVGQVDDSLEDEEFTPCFPPDFPNAHGAKALRQIIVVSRSHAVFPVITDASPIGTIWYISPTERARLAAGE